MHFDYWLCGVGIGNPKSQIQKMIDNIIGAVRWIVLYLFGHSNKYKMSGSSSHSTVWIRTRIKDESTNIPAFWKEW